MKDRYTKSHRTACFNKGDGMAVSVPRIDRSSTTSQRLPCVVALLGSQRNIYCLQCKHGAINKCYTGGQLEPFPCRLVISCPSCEAPQLSLREVIHKEDPSLLLGDRCHCKRGCTTKRCTCRANNRPCLSHCHPGFKFDNQQDKKR